LSRIFVAAARAIFGAGLYASLSATRMDQGSLSTSASGFFALSRCGERPDR
jgi:hypothetical protein